MKIAFLFSGQLRELPIDLFRKSLTNLTKDLDYAIFSYCWEEMGESLNHRSSIPNLECVENIDDKINFLFKDFNLVDYDYESFEDFDKKLTDKHREILNSKKFDFGTIHSLPQIYTLYKSFKLLEKSIFEFDLVFRCRYDSVFVHPIKLFPLNKIVSNNNLYNINFGRAYYPKRVYDIFFGGSKNSMNFIKNIWEDIPSLVNNNFDNGLDKRDCCRILYLAASLNNTIVKSFPSRICDVYRNNDYLYSKYIISSHIINLSFNKNNIKSILHIFNWIIDSNTNYIRISIYIIQTLIFIPFVYFKRIKYLKIN